MLFVLAYWKIIMYLCTMRKERITLRRTVTTDDSVSVVIEKDYTQVYDCFSKMMADVNSVTSFKLLFWLLANKTSGGGGIGIDSITYKEFNDFLISTCTKDCAITRSTFDRCVAELKSVGALTCLTRGHYQANAYGFWRGDTKQRRATLTSQLGDNQLIQYNPDHDTKLIG